MIHVVDDDEGVRNSIAFLLEQEGWPVRTCASAAALMDAPLPPEGCILTDVWMPGMDGLALQTRLAAQGCRLPVIVMTGRGDISLAVRAMKAGVVDFIEKPFREDELIEAVKRALEANRRNLEAGERAARAARRIALLTPREREVMSLVAEGKSNKEVARELGTSPRTIDVHRARLFHKLEIETLPDLVHLVLAARDAPPQ